MSYNNEQTLGFRKRKKNTIEELKFQNKNILFVKVIIFEVYSKHGNSLVGRGHSYNSRGYFFLWSRWSQMDLLAVVQKYQFSVATACENQNWIVIIRTKNSARAIWLFFLNGVLLNSL